MNTVSKMAAMVMVSVLIAAGGCKESSGPAPSGSGTSTSTTTSTTPKSLSADLSETVAQVKEKVQQMSMEQLRQKAEEYKTALAAKQEQLDQVVGQLKSIPVMDQMSDEAQGLQTDMKNLSDSIKALQERFNVYVNAIKAKGGNVSDLATD